MAEELFGAIVDELREIDADNEESDIDDEDDETDFNLVVKKVLNHSIYELIEAESLLKTSDDAEINWEANACDIIEALDEKEKAESEEVREDATDDYSTDTVISSFQTALNHVIYLKQFLMDKGFTNVVEDLSKVESKLEKKFGNDLLMTFILSLNVRIWKIFSIISTIFIKILSLLWRKKVMEN